MSTNSNSNTDNESSGFFDDLSSECAVDFDALIPDKFSNISEIYVSNSGPSRILTATRYGKRFILKCLKEDFRHIPFYQLALAKEFEVGITLDHPNIVKIIGFEDIPETGKAIVMEYIDGDTLQNLISKSAITPQSARSVAIQLSKAIEYLHSKQIVHRDIKPENVMVTYSGNVVKLIDFNLADSAGFTMIKLPAGTRGYMAPEQRQPDAKADAKGDIYSFGVLLLKLGEAAGDNALGHLGRLCTAGDPEKRIQSISELGMETYLSKNDARSGQLLYSRTLTIILAIILTFLTAVAVFLTWQRFAT